MKKIWDKIFFKKEKKKQEIREENRFNIFLEQTEDKLNQKTIIDTKQKHNGDPILEFKNVYKYFGANNKICAVNNLSFTLYDNENVALIGANGAGKTTTVEMLAGITNQSKGEINYLFDYTINFQEKIGIQFQDSAYPNGLKVKHIIKFIVDVYKVDINDAEIEQMITAFGLKEFYNRKAKSLSGGQQQRLNILLALIHKPKIVILDELSTGLDISVRTKIIDFIIHYCKFFNIQILLISHNMDEVELITDRIMIMQKGQLKVDLRKKDVIKKYGSIQKLAEKYI